MLRGLLRTLVSSALLALPAACGGGDQCSHRAEDPAHNPPGQTPHRVEASQAEQSPGTSPAAASAQRQTNSAPAHQAEEGFQRGACEQDRVTDHHAKHASVDKLMDLLGIRPGTTILDIGTGNGEFAYRFAERLNGTGRVYATDIDVQCTAFVAKEAQKRGLSNIATVLVAKDGVDEFYGKHRYDVVTLFHVYYYLEERVSYLKQIRSYLNKNGRVAILYSKKVYPFSLAEFSDFEGFVTELAREPEDSPFRKGLRRSTQALLRQRSPGATHERLRRSIIDDLNTMLVSPHFHESFFGRKNRHRGVSFAPGEKDFVNWLVMSLKEEGSLDKAKADMGPKEIRTIMKVNRLLIMQRFRKHLRLARGREYSPFRVGDTNRQTSKFFISREMREAGYTLVGDHDLSTYYDLLVFAPSR